MPFDDNHRELAVQYLLGNKTITDNMSHMIRRHAVPTFRALLKTKDVAWLNDFLKIEWKSRKNICCR